jgi:hypothetical protein
LKREDVKLGVEAVILKSWDPPTATLLEADLHKRVLRAIAGGADDPKGLAEEAVRTEGLQFKRQVAKSA